MSEGPFDLGVDWRGEVAAARRARTDAEDQSRSPPPCWPRSARRPAASSAPPAPRRWPPRPSSCASAGWPTAWWRPGGPGPPASDGPTPTPTPRRSASRPSWRTEGAVPVSIVRPSIIESALAEPRPGWIRGFRMAEPVIISYARGLLKEFPGVPEGTVDVIPVDLVVGAVVAVAALGPEEAPRITQVASGSLNPLKYRTLVDTVQRLVHRAPALRRRGPAHRGAGVELPGPRAGAAPAEPGQDGHRAGRERAAGAAAAGQAGGVVGPPGGAPHRGGAGADVRRAVRGVRRVRGHLPRRQPLAMRRPARGRPTASASPSTPG